jgi:hypothetical protein
MTRAHTILKYTRLAHLYVGVFISPAILFFAFTGAIQTFSLHETTRGSSYKPPAWAVMLAQIHKKQTPIVPVRRPPPPEKSADTDTTKSGKPDSAPLPNGAPNAPAAATKPPSPDAVVPRPHNTVPLKIFFLLVSIGLFASTLSGLYMSYKFIRNTKLITALLIAGIIVPIVFTIF